MTPRSPGPDRTNPLVFLGLGVQLAATVGLGVWGGQWLDRRQGTEGIFALIGGLSGFAITMYSLIRMLNRRNQK